MQRSFLGKKRPLQIQELRELTVRNCETFRP